MRIRYKLLIIFLILNLILQIACRCLLGSYTVGVVLLSIEMIVLLSGFLVNRMLLKSCWFEQLHADPDHQVYPDNIWYREHDERNFDLVNLGSSSARYAFDYSGEPVRAMNWSSGTQTLIDDYKLVQNFHSILKENGTVLITIMPFTSINKKTGLKDAFRFSRVLDSTLTDAQYRMRCRILEKLPVCFGIPAIKAAVKKFIGKDIRKMEGNDVEKNPMSDNQLEKDALRWINGWKTQFTIADLEQPLTEPNQEGRRIRIGVMRDLVDFLEERGYRPVWVIPPVSGYLRKYFTPGFTDIYIYSYLRQVDRQIPVLDYLDSVEFQDKDLFFNSYFLNKKGARQFTHRVMSDLKRITMPGKDGL